MREIIESQVEEVERQLNKVREAMDFLKTIEGTGAAKLSNALASCNLKLTSLLNSKRISFGSHKLESDYRQEDEDRRKK